MSLKDKVIHWLGGYTKAEIRSIGGFDKVQVHVETVRTERLRSSYTIPSHFLKDDTQTEIERMAKGEVAKQLTSFLLERNLIKFRQERDPMGLTVTGEVLVAKKGNDNGEFLQR